jgi:hypothetical protein
VVVVPVVVVVVVVIGGAGVGVTVWFSGWLAESSKVELPSAAV